MLLAAHRRRDEDRKGEQKRRRLASDQPKPAVRQLPCLSGVEQLCGGRFDVEATANAAEGVPLLATCRPDSTRQVRTSSRRNGATHA